MKSIYQMVRFSSIMLCLFIWSILGGCKKFIEVQTPYTSLNSGNVFSTDATAIAAVTAMYVNIGNAQAVLGGSIPNITFAAGLSADELTLMQGIANMVPYFTNELDPATPPDYWKILYTQIYLANSTIEGLNASNALTPAVKLQLLGEAKFLRAFYYFYLVNLYGDVPLVIATSYKNNSLLSRTASAEIWQQIIADLKEAKELLNSNYVGADVVNGTAATDRIRANKWVSSALLASAYLYIGEWANAEAEATEIINATNWFSLSTTNNTFLRNPTVNKEAIWQIQTVTSGWNTNEARVFILPAAGPSQSYPVYLNKRLVNDFESDDSRRTNWINGIKVGADSFYYAFKYKSATQGAPVTEYNIVFRLGEQFLIRSEARAMQNKFQQAIDDINAIRLQHGGLSNPLAAPTSQAQARIIILHERRVELFTEWGHRWLDLKRTNTADAVMGVETPLKGGTWQPTDKLYPIPNAELIANPNLTQNPGY